VSSYSITSSARARSVGGISTRETKRLGGLHVDDQLGLHRLLHREIGRLPLENPARIDADKAIYIDKVAAVTHFKIAAKVDRADEVYFRGNQ
jgi:hypothetical protein